MAEKGSSEVRQGGHKIKQIWHHADFFAIAFFLIYQAD